MTEAENKSDKPTEADRARRKLKLISAAVLGSGIGLLGALLILLLLNRNRSPELARPAFTAAQQRWESAAPENYDIAIAVTGLRAATYRVEVRDGHPHSATIDDRPLPNRRTFSTWSVPGMFDTIERDLEHVEARATEPSVQRTARLTLYATFDSQRGFPRTYHRIEWGEAGSDLEVTWEVVEFRVR